MANQRAKFAPRWRDRDEISIAEKEGLVRPQPTDFAWLIDIGCAGAQSPAETRIGLQMLCPFRSSPMNMLHGPQMKTNEKL